MTKHTTYHLGLLYLHKFITRQGGQVWPEFPTGNGKIDIMVQFEERIYGLEVKSFANTSLYHQALTQAANYAHKLKLNEINLIFFIEAIEYLLNKRGKTG